ncbi:MAG: DUF3592 domain-containing protein [Paracoccaceae bacterium]|nr:DUF3592 domain-containing protein [Paracoccaceae bacterium]
MESRAAKRGGWIGAIVGLIILAFFGLGLWLLAEAIQFVQIAHRGQGDVIELIADSSGDGLSYSAVVEYRGADGRLYQGITHISSSGYNYRIGERVEILFHPSDPGEVRINSVFSLYGPGLIFAGASGLILLILWIVRARLRKRVAVQAVPAKTPAQHHETDLSKYGHAHEPKPPHQPTVRRMR